MVQRRIMYINRRPPTHRKKTIQEYKRELAMLESAKERAAAEAEERNKCECAGLCIFLGIILGPIGVLISAIIGKAPGVRFSMIGLGIFFLIAILMAFI